MFPGPVSSPGEEICEWELALRWPGECYVCLFREDEFKNGRNMSQDLKMGRECFFVFSLGTAKGMDLNKRQAC